LISKPLLIGALAGGLTLIASVQGLASVSVVTVSKEPSPLAACPNDSQPGRNYVSGEEEPQLAVFGSTMIGMWHQDRWSNGGAHGIGVGTSTGGVTWSQSVFPDDTCSANAGVTTPSLLSFYQRSSDPWVSFGPDGVVYASALSFDATDNKNSVAVGTSSDGGSTWTNVQPILGSIFTSIDQSTDKNATTADPVHAGTAYTVWDTLISPTIHNPDDNPEFAAYTGPAYFSKTTDGGVHWSQAKIIINTTQRQQTIGNIIVVDPRNDTLYDFTDLIGPPNTPIQGTLSNEMLAFVKSTDGGATWTQPQIIAPFRSLGVIDPNTGQRLRVGDGLEEVAVDPSSGKLYAVWESSTNYNKAIQLSSGAWDNEILLVSSSNGGSTWTGPTVVHQLDSGLPTYTPTVAVNGGRVAVTYYDNRFLQSGQTNVLPTDYWVTFSTDGGATFGGEEHIAGSFDELSAPVARGFFLGDYEGLQPSGSGFEALFVTTNCDGPAYTGPLCGPASNTLHPSPNTNPTDVFAAAIS